MRKKHRFAQFLYDTRVLEIFASTGGDSLTVFNYHRIRADDPGFTTLFEEDVFGPTASQFYLQMQWLKKYRRVLSEDELMESMAGKPSALRKCVLVTFDDGYRDNFTLAYPILRELGIPAIFFIPTHLIDTRQLGWWDMIAYLIKQSPKATIDFAGQQLSLRHQRGQVIRFLTQQMKLEKYEVTHDLITKLAEATEVPLPPLAWQDNELMTWDQLREVSTHCVSIGSHTHTHRVLARLKEEIQLEKLENLSKTILERQLGKQCARSPIPLGGVGILRKTHKSWLNALDMTWVFPIALAQ